MNYKEKDIDKVYTDIVLDYLQKGYTIYTPSMSGSQGEVSSVVLTKDDEIICVYIVDRHTFNFKGETVESDTRNIIVGKAKFKPYNHGILWLSELEELSKKKFYKINRYSYRNYNNYYTNDFDFLMQCQAKQEKRLRKKYENHFKSNIYLKHKRAFQIALKHCKQKRGYKSVKMKDIISIYKLSKSNKGYVVEIKDKNNLIIQY